MASIATKSLQDGLGKPFLQQTLDVSGVGNGPFAPLVAVSSADGTHAVDLEALLTSLGTSLTAIQTTLAANNTPLTSLNGGLASTTTAVNAVTSAVSALQAITSTGNATEAQVLVATNTLQTTLAAVQALDVAGNAALGALHNDAINLAALVTAGNAALAALSANTGLGATASNQALAQASLTALTASASTELAKLDAISASITALGTSLGGGKSMADIALLINPLVKTTDIAALAALEANEIALLTDVKAHLAALVAASAQTSTAVTQGGAFTVSVANQPTGLASEATLAQVLTALTANNTAIGLVNTSVASTTAAVNAVAMAVNDLKTLTSTGNATEAQVLTATNTLQTTLSAVQALETAGNAALSALHSDEINLAALVTTGNAALAAINTNTGLGATLANQLASKTALDALNVAATSELAKLDTIATSITALGTSLGGGKNLSDVVLAVNANAKPSDIDALKLAINANETAELAKLASLETLLTSINAAANQTNTAVTISGTVNANIGNFPATQPVSGALTTTDSGLPITGETIPAGGAGVIGWLSALSKLLKTASQDGTDATGVVQATGGVGIRGWLSGIYQTLALLRADPVIGGNALAVKTINSSKSVVDLPVTALTALAVPLIGLQTIALDEGQSLASMVKVTVASGGTLDLVLRESFDDGETFQDIYHVERISGTGTFTIPNMLMHGKRQWGWVISAGASFTFKIATLRGANPAPIQRRFMVYGHNTAQSGQFTPSYNIEGCKFITAAAKVKHNTTTPGAVTSLSFQVSEDNAFFGYYGTTFTATSSTTAGTDVLVLANYTSYGAIAKFIRMITATTVAGNACDYIVIKASN
jgi:hypothetical protein